jgi:riboflavin synthase alpha subunit
MFTGIIRETGVVTRTVRRGGLLELVVQAPRTAAAAAPLESVAVQGVCLSVVAVRHGALVFDVIPETQRFTTLGSLRPGARVHLEPSLTLTDRLSGHILFGHVDGVGTVRRRGREGRALRLDLRVPAGLRRYLVPKGPIAIDGVSLTLGARLGAAQCSIHLIPETMRQTALGALAPGARVNLEVDYLSKVVREALGRHGDGREGAKARLSSKWSKTYRKAAASRASAV